MDTAEQAATDPSPPPQPESSSPPKPSEPINELRVSTTISPPLSSPPSPPVASPPSPPVASPPSPSPSSPKRATQHGNSRTRSPSNSEPLRPSPLGQSASDVAAEPLNKIRARTRSADTGLSTESLAANVVPRDTEKSISHMRQRSRSLGAADKPKRFGSESEIDPKRSNVFGILSKKKSEREEHEMTPIRGTKIDEHHRNYVLMYDMLSGIRVTLSRCYAKPAHTIEAADFVAANKLAFDITGNELTPSSKYDFKFKDYAPYVFRSLRAHFKIDPVDYLVSLTGKYILSELGSPGKSGSFFYFSADYRFIIKTISSTEHAFFLQLLPKYYQHVMNNPNTLLARYYGLHRVKLPRGPKIHFVVMGNVFPPNRDIHFTFDLKGSTLGRFTPPKKDGSPSILKDQNFIELHRKLMLGPEKRKMFVEQVQSDSRFLAENNIMDYSLLLGIHDLSRGNKEELRSRALSVFKPQTNVAGGSLQNLDVTKKERKQIKKKIENSQAVALGSDNNPLPEELPQERKLSVFCQDEGGFQSTDENNKPLNEIYHMGIIDILTPYDYKKRIEHAFKSINHNENLISAIEPVKYAERFANFLVNGTVEYSKGKGKKKLERKGTSEETGLEQPPSPPASPVPSSPFVTESAAGPA